MLGASLFALIAADLLLADGRLWLGAAAWGLHLGLSEGALQALVAEVVPKRARGRAFGLIGVVGGIAAIAASLGAGALWTLYGAGVVFVTGAGVATLALAWRVVMPSSE